MNASDVIAVARQSIARYGSHSGSIMDRRARENTQAGDRDAAEFLAQVAKAVRVLSPQSDMRRLGVIDRMESSAKVMARLEEPTNRVF